VGRSERSSEGRSERSSEVILGVSKVNKKFSREFNEFLRDL